MNTRKEGNEKRKSETGDPAFDEAILTIKDRDKEIQRLKLFEDKWWERAKEHTAEIEELEAKLLSTVGKNWREILIQDVANDKRIEDLEAKLKECKENHK